MTPPTSPSTVAPGHASASEPASGSPRVLVDATPLQSEHRLRGVGMYLRALLDELVPLLGERGRYLVASQGPWEGLEPIPARQRVALPRPHRPAQVYWLYNEWALRRALHRVRPEVFFAPDFNGLVRNPWGRTVAVLHDLTELKLLRAGAAGRSLSPSRLLSDLRWRVYYRKLPLADRLVAISEAVKRDAVELLGLPATSIAVVPHGLDARRFAPAVGEGAYAGVGPYLLHVGARNENKNHERLLQAFARIADAQPELRLLLAGRWQPRDLAWLERRRAELGLGTRIEHLGFVPDADLASLYGNATAFVFPSLEEGFGLPLVEAMACGAPVISSARGAMREVAEGAAELVDPTDVDALAAAIARVAEHPGHAQALRERGFERSRRYRWEVSARKLLEVLEPASGKARDRVRGSAA